MDLINWLSSLVASDGAHVAAAAVAVGLIVFGLVQFADQQFHLGSNPKFWLSVGLAFLVPVVAYIALELLTHAPIDLNGLFLAISVGFLVSQGIHRVGEQASAAAKAAS